MNTGAVFNLPEHTLYNVERRYDQNRQGGAFISINVTEQNNNSDGCCHQLVREWAGLVVVNMLRYVKKTTEATSCRYVQMKMPVTDLSP